MQACHGRPDCAILHTAEIQNEEVLILGTFGCGVFGNDAREVAEIFNNYLNHSFRGSFKKELYTLNPTAWQYTEDEWECILL